MANLLLGRALARGHEIAIRVSLCASRARLVRQMLTESTANAPVLVIRGTNEEFMSRADSEAIVESVNRVRPGQGRYVEVPGMTHGFFVNKKFHAELIPTILSWMKDQLSATK